MIPKVREVVGPLKQASVSEERVWMLLKFWVQKKEEPNERKRYPR